MLLNTSSHIRPYLSNEGLHGVILPQSEKVLFENDIDIKIQKTRQRIEFLSSNQAQRNTHGGKRYRAKRVSRNAQIDVCNEELKTLNAAKEMILNPRPVARNRTVTNAQTESSSNTEASGLFSRFANLFRWS